MKILTVLLVLLVCTSMPIASAEDRFETMRHEHIDNPTVCIMEPDEELQIRFYHYLLHEAYNTVMEWQTEMTEFSQGDWYMPMILVEYENHFDRHVREFPQCNVFIEFDMHNTGDVVNSTALGYTAYDFSNSRHHYAYIKVYVTAEKLTSKASICIGCNNNDIAEAQFKTTKNHEYLEDYSVKKILLHEFGHALGLGHYVEDKDKTNNQDSLMFPFMSAFSPDNKNAKIELIDKILLVQMYSFDGFGGHQGFQPRYFEISDLLRDWIT